MNQGQGNSAIDTYEFIFTFLFSQLDIALDEKIEQILAIFGESKQEMDWADLNFMFWYAIQTMFRVTGLSLKQIDI